MFVTVASDCEKRAKNSMRCFQHWGGVKRVECDLLSTVLCLLAYFLAFCGCLCPVAVSGW